MSRRRWRILVLLGLGAVWWASPSVTGVSGASHATPDAQARICGQLARAQATFGNQPSVGQALAQLNQRYRCTGAQPPATTTTLPPTTTTSIHVDCPLPGGGVGPCPTTTTSTIFPGPTPTLPGTTTTSIHFDCPLPGGGVGPCPTTTTSTIVFPGTTVPTTVPSP